MKGFTLLEVLITCAILGIVTVGILAALNVSNMSWNTDSALLDLQAQTRLAMDVVTRESRQSSPDQPGREMNISDSGASIDFYIPEIADAISYNLSNETMTREYPPGTIRFVANNITNLTFCCVGGNWPCSDCANSSILQISIKSAKVAQGRPLSFNLSEQVKLRNE